MSNAGQKMKLFEMIKARNILKSWLQVWKWTNGIQSTYFDDSYQHIYTREYFEFRHT